MKITIRHASISIAVIAAFLLGTLFALSQVLTRTQDDAIESHRVRYASYLLADELRQSSDDLTRLARTYVSTGDAAHEAAYWKILAVRNGKKPRSDRRAISPGETVALKELMGRYNFADDEFAKLKEAENNSNDLVTTETIAMNAVKGKFADGKGAYTKVGEPDLELARRIMFDAKYHGDKDKITAPINEFFALLDKRTDGRATALGKTAGGYLAAIVAVLVAFLVFQIVVLVFLRNRIVRSVLHAREVVSGLSEGDLTQRIEIDHGDELSALANDINNSFAGLAGIIQTVQKSSGSLDSSATQLHTISDGLSDSTQQMDSQAMNTAKAAEEISMTIGSVATSSQQASANVSTVATSSERISASVQSISAQTNEMSNTITSVASAIEEMTSSLGEVARNGARTSEASAQCSTMARTASEQMGRLGDSAADIDKIVEMIGDIADQTNLLALNATIEAASAGDAGRGFAVVASEVKTLAAQTAKATGEIADQVKSMQEITGTTLEMIQDVSRQIDEVNGLSGSIAVAVEEQTAAMGDISRNVSLGATAASSISNAVDEISSGAGAVAVTTAEVAAGVTEITRSAAEVASGSDRVAKQVSGFASLTRASAKRSADVRAQSQGLNEIAGELASSVAHFRV